jgi:hypothetical protein
MASAAVAAAAVAAAAVAAAIAAAIAAVAAAIASTAPVAIWVPVPAPRVILKGSGLCLNARCRA